MLYLHSRTPPTLEMQSNDLGTGMGNQRSASWHICHGSTDRSSRTRRLNTITVCNLYGVLGHGTLKGASISSRVGINYQFLLFSLELPIFRKCPSNHSEKWTAKQLILARSRRVEIALLPPDHTGSRTLPCYRPLSLARGFYKKCRLSIATFSM
jgi:hypothetical protein